MAPSESPKAPDILYQLRASWLAPATDQAVTSAHLVAKMLSVQGAVEGFQFSSASLKVGGDTHDLTDNFRRVCGRTTAPAGPGGKAEPAPVAGMPVFGGGGFLPEPKGSPFKEGPKPTDVPPPAASQGPDLGGVSTDDLIAELERRTDALVFGACEFSDFKLHVSASQGSEDDAVRLVRALQEVTRKRLTDMGLTDQAADLGAKPRPAPRIGSRVLVHNVWKAMDGKNGNLPGIVLSVNTSNANEAPLAHARVFQTTGEDDRSEWVSVYDAESLTEDDLQRLNAAGVWAELID